MAQRTVTSLQESRVYERAYFDVEVTDFEMSVYFIYRYVLCFCVRPVACVRASEKYKFIDGLVATFFDVKLLRWNVSIENS